MVPASIPVHRLDQLSLSVHLNAFGNHNRMKVCLELRPEGDLFQQQPRGKRPPPPTVLTGCPSACGEGQVTNSLGGWACVILGCHSLTLK